MLRENFAYWKSSLAIVCFMLLMGMAPSVHAQVGINNPDPDASAILDLKAIDKGLLIPRMTTSQRENMSQGGVPANSLLVFDTDINMFVFYHVATNNWIALNPWKFQVPVDVFSEDMPPMVLYTDPLFTGNVGIGVTEPTEKLEVAGGIKNSGDIISAGNLTTTNIAASGNTTVGGNVSATGTLSGSKVYGEGTVPPGAIMMWSGTTPPAGWALCNGSNSTPDLRGRFIVGHNPADAEYNAIGKTGGAKAVALTEAQMPAHSHKYKDRHRDNGNAGGEKEHRGGLAATDITFESEKTGGVYVPAVDTRVYDETGYECEPGVYDPKCNPNYMKLISGSYTPAYYTTEAHENRPPYYTLAYIIKLPY